MHSVDSDGSVGNYCVYAMPEGGRGSVNARIARKRSVGCRWRMMFSTCLLVWSLSSLFITHKMFKSNVRREEEAAVEESVKMASCDDNKHKSDDLVTGGQRERQVIQGWFDFQGELLHVGNIDPEGSDKFSSDDTEFDMKIGLGRHDRSFTSLIYDRVKYYSFS